MPYFECIRFKFLHRSFNGKKYRSLLVIEKTTHILRHRQYNFNSNYYIVQKQRLTLFNCFTACHRFQNSQGFFFYHYHQSKEYLPYLHQVTIDFRIKVYLSRAAFKVIFTPGALHPRAGAIKSFKIKNQYIKDKIKEQFLGTSKEADDTFLRSFYSS